MDAEEFALSIGYCKQKPRLVPHEATFGPGCGNPTALASLQQGEVVLDLGSRARLEGFLAASRVDPAGKVIGVVITPEKIRRARRNAEINNIRNRQSPLGKIEEKTARRRCLPGCRFQQLCDYSLSDQPQVFRQIYRVLEPGGRVSISEIALRKLTPESIRDSLEAYVGCLGGAIPFEQYKRLVEPAGPK